MSDALINRDALESAIETLVALLDAVDGEADIEHNGDLEPSGDEKDAAWIEWQTMRGSQKGGANRLVGHEDDEEDDPSGQCDEDDVNTDLLMATGGGPGCTISDSDSAVDDWPCDDIEMDREPDDGR